VSNGPSSSRKRNYVAAIKCDFASSHSQTYPTRLGCAGSSELVFCVRFSNSLTQNNFYWLRLCYAALRSLWLTILRSNDLCGLCASMSGRNPACGTKTDARVITAQFQTALYQAKQNDTQSYHSQPRYPFPYKALSPCCISLEAKFSSFRP